MTKASKPVPSTDPTGKRAVIYAASRDLVSAAACTATSNVNVQTIFAFIICSAQHQERQLI